MWNYLDLKCPSDDFSEYPPQDQYISEELRDLVTVLSTAANTLTSENPLWDELKVLENIQQKYKRLLRCDKCLILLRRVAHCVKKMVLLNLSKSCLDLAERFLVGFQNASLALTLPSRQQLEYLLIRSLAASKLVSEGIKYSQETFCFLIQKLKVGHLLLDLVMAASVVARLNILLRATLDQLSSVYQEILLWRYKLKKGTFQWSTKLDFPQDIKDWIKNFESGCLEPFLMSHADVGMLSNLLMSSSGNHDSDAESIILLNEVISVDNANVSDVTDYGELMPRKKIRKNNQLSPLQKSLLQKIVQTQSLNDLEKLWMNIFNFPQDHFLKELKEQKQSTINKFFTKIKNTLPSNKFNKIFSKESNFLKAVHLKFSKHLGFTEEDVVKCKNDLANVAEEFGMELVPVRTCKKLKNLYNRLCEMLQFLEKDKHRKLQKIFKRRMKVIKVLKQEGERETAKKYIFSTSKRLLALCQK